MNHVSLGNFTQQEPILDEGIAADLAVLQHGRLHRYNEVEGEVAEAAMLEKEFAAQVGAKYALQWHQVDMLWQRLCARLELSPAVKY